MAITESSPTQPGSGEPPASGPPQTRARARAGGWRWVKIALAALVAAALVVLAVLAWTYQPVQFGGESGGTMPGLPPGTGLRDVNTFMFQPGQLYVPPQLGAFTIVESIDNAGPMAVTIEAVTIFSPQEQSMVAGGASPWPFTSAGQVMGYIETWHSPLPAPRPVTGLSLAPGHVMRIGIPVRLSGTCYDPGGWSEDAAFYVKERFGIVTHWVAVPFAIPLLVHEPFYPHQDSYAICLSR